VEPVTPVTVPTVQVWPTLEVTVYPVITAPPVDGAVQVTAACVLTVDAVAVAPVGAPGVVAGVADAEAAEAGPVPFTLVAVTVKV
jgi:hypothetical protein